MTETTTLSPLGGALKIPLRAAIPGTTALVFLGSFALLAFLSGPLLGDPDTQWHVAIGRSIVAARAVPWTDSFSHTFAGQPWIAKEWLAQVLLATAADLRGWASVALLAATSAAASLALLHAWLARRLQSTAALAVTLIVGLLLAPHLLARPHVLAMPAMLLWTCGIVGAADRGRAPPWWMPLIMAVWANLHAGFTIGFAVAGLIALDAVLQASKPRRIEIVGRWALFFTASLLAACATPYGYHPMLVTLTLFGSGEPLPFIQEWQPLAFDAHGLLAVGLMLSTAAALMRRLPGNAVRLALVTLFSVMALRHTRFLDLFALLAPVVAAAPSARAFPSLAAETRPQGTGAGSRLVATVAGSLIAAVALGSDPRPSSEMTPIAALQAARLHGLTEGKVYNAYDFGGFLIAEGVKTFIDGRSDQIFLGGFTRAVHGAAANPDPMAFLSLLDRYQVVWALVRPGSGESHHLAGSSAWTHLHRDSIAEVFIRR